MEGMEDIMSENIEETKTIRISLATWIKLNQMRGFNNCKTFEDTLIYLIKSNEKQSNN